jgi:hypothetical protein
MNESLASHPIQNVSDCLADQGPFLFNVFAHTTFAKLQNFISSTLMTNKLAELKGFDTEEAFNVIRTQGQGRSLELTEDRFWQMGYGSNVIHLLFNLSYRDFNYTPAYENNLPQVDHIFPQSLLIQEKVRNPETGRMVMKYRASERDQLANCMLLSQEENGAGGKSDTPPAKWFAKRVAEDSEYLDKHLVPKDRTLWELDRFEDFIVARKKLLLEHFRALKVLPVSLTPAAASLALTGVAPTVTQTELPPTVGSTLAAGSTIAFSWDVVLKEIENPAVKDFVGAALARPHQESNLAKRLIIYRIDSTRRFWLGCRKKYGSAWQRGRFEGDDKYWARVLSEPDMVQPVNHGQALRFLLTTRADFDAFAKAMNEDLAEVEFSESGYSEPEE